MATYEAMWLRIADDLARVDIIPQIQAAILTAIEKYERKPWWFLEGSFDFTTVADQDMYGVADAPSLPLVNSIMRVRLTYTANSRWDLDQRAWGEIERISTNPQIKGRPIWWAWFNNDLRLYPIPDNPYVMTVFGRIRPAPLAGAGDTNVWTTTAEEMIRAAATARVCKDTTQDWDRAQIEAEAASAAERALLGENYQKQASGRVRATRF